MNSIYSQSQNIVIDNNKIGYWVITDNINHEQLINSLEKKFPKFNFKKEIGEQDGPDFIIISAYKESQKVFNIFMSTEDTLIIESIYFEAKGFEDIDGIKKGIKYSEIKELHGSKVSHYVNYHEHLYVTIVGSKLKYELGIVHAFPDNFDFENPKVSYDFAKDLKVKRIIWEK